MTLKGGSYAEGAPVKASTGTPEREADLAFQWRVIPMKDEENDLFRIQNVASGTYLVGRGKMITDGAQLSVWANPERGWVARPVPGEPNARM